MYNPFSFIPLWIKKWTDGTRFDLVKMVASSLLFVLCVIILIKWNIVPTVNDSLYLATYKGKYVRNDNVGYNVSVVHPYNNFSNLHSANASYEIGVQGTWERDTSDYLFQTKETDSLLSIMKNNKLDVHTDSIIMLCHAKIKINTTNFHATKANLKTESDSAKHAQCFVKAYTETNDTAWTCGEMIAAFNEPSSEKHEPLIFQPGLFKSDVRLKMNGLINWFRLEDISQCYYKLDIKNKCCDGSILSLRVNLGGAVRFSQIDPEPDRMDYSCVTYTDKNKLAKIQGDGLKFHCQLLEASGLQSVRIYLLSAFATFFLGISLKILFEILWRYLKKELSNGKK